MKCHKISAVLVLGIILSLPLVAFPVIPAQAAGTIKLTLYPDEGKLDDEVNIFGWGFGEGELFHLYFSRDKADEGDDIDDEVTHYKLLQRNVRTSGETSLSPGEFDTFFKVPQELDDGEDKEDVHDGDYYVYATYRTSKDIVAVASFTVIDGEIEVDPEEAIVGAEVKIGGEGLRPEQEITVEYDGYEVDIISGDTRTESDGQFICTIIVPEGPAGSHTITVIDESGNKPEAECSVKPQITLTPPTQAIDKSVKVSGMGFGDRERITITLDGDKVVTTPISLHTNRLGSLGGSFIIPHYPAYTDGAIGKVEVRDESLNVAEAELGILPILAGMSLDPTTSLTSPGHVGMELTVDGIWFIADTTVTITYSNGGALAVATATSDKSRSFLATFTVPPSLAGSHTVTATDGTNRITSIFTMESEKPPTPAPLLPEFVATAEAKAYFDWESATDLSGVSYSLQIGADDDFTAIVLEKEGLTDSEYTLTEEEKLASTEKEASYYWRVKAIDGAFNESGWTASRSFYVGFSWTSMPAWSRYIWIGLGGLVAVILVFWVRRKRTG